MSFFSKASHDLERGRSINISRKTKPRSYSASSNVSAVSLASIRTEFGILQKREDQRRKVLDYLFENLDHGFNRRINDTLNYGLKPRGIAAELIDLAEKLYETKDYSFNRFEKLALVNVLHWQHRLIKLDEKLRSGDDLFVNDPPLKNQPKPSPVNDDDAIQGDTREVEEEEWVEIDELVLNLSNALHQYYTAINDFNHILHTYKQPDTARSHNIGALLAKTFHEPRYWDSPDSLNLMDLRPTAGHGGTVDWLRGALQKMLPNRFLDASGKDRRELDKRKRSGEMTRGSAKILQGHRLHTRHISPSVDRFARIVMAVIGSLILLVPMIVLSFVTSRTWSLITTALFVLFFAFALALFSNASNQEILAVAATYSAVLVVFVGNLLQQQH